VTIIPYLAATVIEAAQWRACGFVAPNPEHRARALFADLHACSRFASPADMGRWAARQGQDSSTSATGRRSGAFPRTVDRHGAEAASVDAVAQGLGKDDQQIDDFYRSSNGDRWRLVRDSETGHRCAARAQLSSGGRIARPRRNGWTALVPVRARRCGCCWKIRRQQFVTRPGEPCAAVGRLPQAQLSKGVRDLSGRPQLLGGDLHRPGTNFTAPSSCGTAIGETTTGVAPVYFMSSSSATFGVPSTMQPRHAGHDLRPSPGPTGHSSSW
jgi:hypothetical protein